METTQPQSPENIEHEGVSPPRTLGERAILVSDIISVERSEHLQMRATTVLDDLRQRGPKVYYKDYLRIMTGLGYRRDDINRAFDDLDASLNSDLTISIHWG